MKVRLEFKPQDLWVGIFWRRRGCKRFLETDVWICLFPMLPIHFYWYRLDGGGGA